jgi:putative transposase
MANRYRVFSEQNCAYFVTCTVVEWLPVFARDEYRRIALDALAFLRAQKHTELNAFVIMPTHFHAILWPEEGTNLSGVLRDFKRFTSRGISREAKRLGETDILERFTTARQRGRAQDVSQYQVWQEGSHPEMIYSLDFARRKIDYIHDNPVRAGLSGSALDWLYSSAKAYFLGEETYPPTDLLWGR